MEKRACCALCGKWLGKSDLYANSQGHNYYPRCDRYIGLGDEALPENWIFFAPICMPCYLEEIK